MFGRGGVAQGRGMQAGKDLVRGLDEGGVFGDRRGSGGSGAGERRREGEDCGVGGVRRWGRPRLGVVPGYYL